MIVAGLILAGCAAGDERRDGPAGPAWTDEDAARFQAALDQGRADVGTVAAAGAVLRSDGALWVGASGEAEPDDRFGIGSITKTYVAAAVLRAADRGDFDLDAPVAPWVPQLPDGARITVRQLLSHTTGLPDFVLSAELLTTFGEPHTLEELLAMVADEPLQFDPGADHAYSNTNYVVLGLLLGAVGNAWEDQVQALLGAAALDETAVRDPIPTVRGFVGSADTTGTFDPTNAGSAGQMAASAGDVARWGAALYAGDVVPLASVDAMEDPVPESLDEPEGYGLGTMVLATGDDVFVGHSGSIVGFQSRLRVRRSDGMVVVALIDDFVAEADTVDAALWAAVGGPSPASGP